MDKLDAITQELKQFRRETNEKLDTLHRGVYGDPVNRVPGLMQRQDDDEARMDGIEARQDKTDQKLWKIGATMGAAVAGLDFAIMYIKGFFK